MVENRTSHMKAAACYGESERGECLVGNERHLGKRQKNRKGERKSKNENGKKRRERAAGGRKRDRWENEKSKIDSSV